MLPGLVLLITWRVLDSRDRIPFKGKSIDFQVGSRKNPYDLISARMVYLSLAYDNPTNFPNRQLYAHVVIATIAVMTHILLSSVREKVDHCSLLVLMM